jgi:hypothetical protein
MITIPVNGRTALTPEQDTLKPEKDLSNGAKSSKNANRWDAFGNFIQLTGNDITGDSKGIQFKGVLFPLFSQDSAKSNSSKYYLKRTWMRNSELQVGVKFAKGNSVNAINLGYNYAIVNLRDKSLQNFYFKEEKIVSIILANAGDKFIDGLSSQKKLSFIKALNDYTSNGKIGAADSGLMNNFIKILNDSIKGHPELHSLSYSEAVKYNSSIYDSLAELVARRPLLTINPMIQYNPILGKVNGLKGTGELIFGLGKRTSKKPWEVDLKFDYTLGDTIANKANLNRQVFTGNLGFNKVLMIESDRKTSLMEFKIGGEMDIVTSGLYKNEDQYRYFANATLRIRAGKSFWIPVVLKYDIRTSNLLGFLNLSINLDNNSSKNSN